MNRKEFDEIKQIIMHECKKHEQLMVCSNFGELLVLRIEQARERKKNVIR